MKSKVLFLLLIILTSIICFPQDWRRKPEPIQRMNPDGYIGGYTIEAMGIYNYGIGEYKIKDMKIGDVEYPGNFQVSIILTLPMSEDFSLKFLYQNQGVESRINPPDDLKNMGVYKEAIISSVYHYGVSVKFYMKSFPF